MAVLTSLNDNSAGDGFLLAPLDSTYDAQLKLKTDPATPSATITIQASPNPAGLVFSTMGPIAITPVETIVTVHSMMQSVTRGDTVIQVLEAGVVVASFAVTSIKHAAVNFRGRFEARFATQPAQFNQNAMYKDPAVSTTSEAVGPGWTWGLEGEPDFVPGVNVVPEHLDWTGMGRVIRLNLPVPRRFGTQPVVSTVISISGETVNNPNEIFTTGDALINQPVNFGPDTYFAGNRENSSPTPEEFYDDAYEPLGLFQIHFGNTPLFISGDRRR